MTDNGIKYIGKHCVKLNYLNIKGYKALRDVGITHIVQKCFKLIFLDMGKCNIMDYDSDGMHNYYQHSLASVEETHYTKM